jgi:ribose transport system substrate-binding protein
MKKTVMVLLALCLAAGFVFAAGGSQGGAAKYDVGFSLSTLNNPFFVSMQEGAEARAKELGVKLSVVGANDDPAKQVKDIEDMVNSGIKVLIVNPADSAAVAPTVKDVIAKGIKVIAVDRYVDGVTVDTFIGTDNVLAANFAGEYFTQVVGPRAVIAVLEGVPAASSNIDRMEGYRQALTKAGLRAKVTQTANYNRDEGLRVTENILQANPDITAILPMNDEMALGAIQAVKSVGKVPGKDILVAGFDAGDDARAAVKAGEMIYTVEQKTVEMGRVAVESAQKFIQGQSVPKNIPIQVEIVKP